ncbi:MAG: tRNA dihydrouridine(20/20a) synthase DusA [Gammaproteobacteria bacterium]|nr:tRNA dihydrouridine(20/20a) synthase DusA [Gammaproteobacteria bacterium]MBT5116300.1 tRNA dihydrouridine(20/20a) synthase DusA [Gammaproteobacteria bacterium]MBT5863528.1 tRNA dihydrouridine(20/20a) synthase DusA [Gammaproteobacteria bacterium]MBT7236246.1 tRNA dihydrouridine(20/20a) synthase DusA [Gammaproteobacteria bacterium]
MNNKRIYLAPMVGRTDQYYRSFVRILSKNIYLYTEMITCDSFLHTDRKNYTVKEEEKNLTIQLAGSDPKKYGLCASIIEEKGYNEINLNIGCPSSKVVKGEFGACLMRDPDKVADCVYEIKKSCSLPISIKTRLGLGYEENLDLLFNLIDKTKDSGCSKYIIHARNAILNGLSPKKNRKIPLLRYADVSVIKNAYPDLKFYLNGGVDDILEIRKNINKFDGLMIGRKIYDNPMFLNEIEEKIYGNEGVLSRKSILDEYLKYALSPENKDTSNYLLLRHLFSLYYNTSSSKKWKKFIHDIIQSDKNIELITNFEESTYD